MLIFFVIKLLRSLFFKNTLIVQYFKEVLCRFMMDFLSCSAVFVKLNPEISKRIFVYFMVFIYNGLWCRAFFFGTQNKIILSEFVRFHFEKLDKWNEPGFTVKIALILNYFVGLFLLIRSLGVYLVWRVWGLDCFLETLLFLQIL